MVARIASSEQKSLAIAASLPNGFLCCASQAAWNIRCLPASISVAMSASWKAMPWKLAIAWPNCFRVAAYFTASSYAPSAMPNDSAAIPTRPESSVRMKFENPFPSSPSRFSAGTSTSSKISSRVSEARHPSLSSFFPERNPGIAGSDASCPMPAARVASRSVVCLVRMKELMPFVPFDGSVTAVATKISPTPPCVMKILLPLRR